MQKNKTVSLFQVINKNKKWLKNEKLKFKTQKHKDTKRISGKKKISIILYGQCSKSIVNIDINEQTGLHQTKKVSMCQNKQQMQKTAHELEENPQ